MLLSCGWVMLQLSQSSKNHRQYVLSFTLYVWGVGEGGSTAHSTKLSFLN